MNALTIGTTAIRLYDGLYSLNDLHKAAGGEEHQRPNQFIRLDQTQALIAEIETAQMCAVKTKEGRNGGTYVCRELVYAYANWISPAFYLKMIRFFDAQHPAALPPTEITKAQAGEIAALLAERFPVGKDRPYAWSRFNNHFRLASYKDLPAARFAEACDYIHQMPVKGSAPALTEPSLESLAEEKLLNQRFLVTFYRTTTGSMKTILVGVPRDSHVVTEEEIVQLVKEPCGFKRSLLPNLIQAAAGRLQDWPVCSEGKP